jgi:hypothetical protein
MVLPYISIFVSGITQNMVLNQILGKINLHLKWIVVYLTMNLY